MNLRIKELAEQATIKVNNPILNSNGKVVCDNWEEGVSLSKFAALIVRECAWVAIKKQTENDICGIVSENPARDFADELIKHFGVEE